MAAKSRERIYLTPQIVENAEIRSTRYLVSDSEVLGLLLRVSPTGVKRWVAEYGRHKYLVIGSYPNMTVSNARKVAKKAIAEAQVNGEPELVAKKRKAKEPKPTHMTVREYYDEIYYPHTKSNLKDYKSNGQQIEKHFAFIFDKALKDVSSVDFVTFKARAEKAGMSKATINRNLGRIGGMFRHAFDESRVISVNPLAGVKRHKNADQERTRHLVGDERKNLFDAIEARETFRRNRRKMNLERTPEKAAYLRTWSEEEYTDHIKPLILLAMNTGMRRGELLKLKWSDVDFERGQIEVRKVTTKSDKTRHIPMNTITTEVLTQWRKQADKPGYVFMSRDGGKIDNFRKAWNAIKKRAKLVDFRFHDLRHDFASGLVMESEMLLTVSRLLGHGDMRTTQRYAHFEPDYLKASVHKLDKRNAR